MTQTLPSSLEKALVTRAEQRSMKLDELVQEALSWYLQLEPELVDELAAWQEIRDEALQVVEDQST